MTPYHMPFITPQNPYCTPFIAPQKLYHTSDIQFSEHSIIFLLAAMLLPNSRHLQLFFG